MNSGVHKVVVYGSNGYTARLLLPRLKALGVEIVAAGRNASAVAEIANELGLSRRVFALSDPKCIDDNLADATLLLNTAGPFVHTARPLIDACLRQRVDYLDLSGELEPLAYAAECGEFARCLGVMLLPAVGFDVVPSDCLAVHLVEQLPSASRLTISISASNLLSRGSASTFAEHAGTWVHVRRDGALEPVRLRTQMRWVDFGTGIKPTIAVSWGDLVTAFRSTGIPNLEVYFEATAFRWTAVTSNQIYNFALRNPAIKSWFGALARAIPDGPTEDERASEHSVIVGEVTDGVRRKCSRLVTPEAYTFTADIATRVIDEVLRGKRRPGFETPGRLFGSDFVLRAEGVSRDVLE